MDKLHTVYGPQELWLIRAALIKARNALSVRGPSTLEFAREKAEIDAALMLVGFTLRSPADTPSLN